MHKDTENTNDDEINELDDIDNMEIQNTEPDKNILGNYKNINKFLNASTHKQPRAEFLPDHIEAMLHILKINKPKNYQVPVPIGPSIPHQDHK